MRTIWRRHTTVLLVIGTMLVIIAAAIGFMVNNFSPRNEVRLGANVYSVRLAVTDAEKQRGLSGTESLASNEGMLFDFETPGYWGIWMKDMLIPIDIVWLDEEKMVVTIVKNAPPELGEDETYRPTEPARYVLELPAGATSRDGIKIGDVAQFEVSR